MSRKKILFVAEAVTLAHVARPLALANSLASDRYDIQFACADGYDFFFKNTDFGRHTISSISSAQFLASLAAGRPVYEYQTLMDYVANDLGLIEQVQPDLIVGDFRLSLSVSARIAKLPYISITNAYWSPFVRQHYTVPHLPITNILPIPIADRLFKLVRPAAFSLHALPLNRVRRKHGLKSVGVDLRRVYTDSDHTLYADVPELFPPYDMPSNHSYLGPVIWSPPVAPPHWWDALPEGKPIVYVTLGSSGQGQLIPSILQALESLPVTVIVATAGKIQLDAVPENAHVADYLPGEAAARRARLVICNGGSPTSQQALAAGVPVIGIAGNLDQFLNMAAIESTGAGRCLRADRFDVLKLQRIVSEMTSDSMHTEAAAKVAGWFGRYPAGSRFTRVLTEIM